ncbi:hypothetical protein O0I10_004994 [Lichtheimia ornata]|uniref:Uncharacterized protein n=1 Tax=Lichtheimia ornata TaxID=688661 RepID=A0AAD7V6P3_9FUNG|nr:uncharacterized protein O0I10_004994 [Lichtheimia ornata]KAJ8659280.1 hypothetical protein O0I10_004994 [Lichtheimia ornata]
MGTCPTQWENKKASGVVYMPLEPYLSPPIIVEVQHSVDIEFIFRIMSYCEQLYSQVNIAPVVLIIVVSSINHEVLGKCRARKQVPFLFQYRKETWAKSCYRASVDTIHRHTQKVSLDPMVNLMAFLTGRKPSLSDSGYSTDPTMQQLYSIAERAFVSCHE